MLQDTPEKKQQAIEALKNAAKDPKYRSEAGLWLGQVYTDLGKHDEALKVFRSLMGSDVRTPQQTTAAVEVIGLLADTGKLEDLTAYLDRLSSPGRGARRDRLVRQPDDRPGRRVGGHQILRSRAGHLPGGAAAQPDSGNPERSPWRRCART